MSEHYPSPARKKRHKKRRRINLIPVCLLLSLILAGLVFVAWQMGSGTALDALLKMENVTIAGISMEGLSKQDAKAVLRPIGEACSNTPLVIHIQDDTHSFTPQDLALRPDTDKAVDEAWRNRTTGTVDLLPYLGVDTQMIRQLVDSLAQRYNQDFVRSEVSVTGNQPDLDADPVENEPNQMLNVTMGVPQFGLDTENLYAQILKGFLTGHLEITAQYRELLPEIPDLTSLWQQTYVAPLDAVMNEKTFEVTPDIWGYGFDLEAATEAVAALAYGQSLSIPFARIQADNTAEEVGGHLYRDVLGEAKTPYKGEDSNNRNTNLALACEAINGVVLLPGETFSYNNTLGERTAAKGYKPAPSYEAGLTVDTLGGGICQVSSTLYYSTLFADLEIVRRYNHGYVSDYIDPGMDATVTWGGADFKFKNNTAYPIRIEAWREDGFVNVKIFGTDDRDYYVKMTYKVLSTTGYKKVYREMTADNEWGYVDGDTIVTPYQGMTARAYKEKYSKATNALISKTEESYNVYNSRDWVLCKIVEATTAPTETTSPDEPTLGENELPEIDL